MYILLICLLCEYRPTSYLLPPERAPEQKLAREDRISQVKCDLAHSKFPFSKERKSNRKRSDNDMLHQVLSTFYNHDTDSIHKLHNTVLILKEHQPRASTVCRIVARHLSVSLACDVIARRRVTESRRSPERRCSL